MLTSVLGQFATYMDEVTYCLFVLSFYSFIFYLHHHCPF